MWTGRPAPRFDHELRHAVARNIKRFRPNAIKLRRRPPGIDACRAFLSDEVGEVGYVPLAYGSDDDLLSFVPLLPVLRRVNAAGLLAHERGEPAVAVVRPHEDGRTDRKGAQA